jgi:uncharacterized protein (TIGR03118 family)
MFSLWTKSHRRGIARRASHLGHRGRLSVEKLEDRTVPSTAYLANDLISDQPGLAPLQDPAPGTSFHGLHNAWGISYAPTGGTFWVSSNGDGTSNLYSGGANGTPITKNSLEVSTQGSDVGDGPTGQVFNSTTSDFQVSDGTKSGKPAFIFVTELGVVSGWAPGVNINQAQIGYTAPDNAVYKGLALASNSGGNFLFATDFRNAKIDVLGTSIPANNDFQYHKVTLNQGIWGSFSDPHIPAGYAPFNIAALTVNGTTNLYVSYAKQDPASNNHDEVDGAGLGFIDIYDTTGHLITTQKPLVSGGPQSALNAPWGMVIAPSNFGDFSNDLIVGNFGNGWINAYNPSTGAFQGSLRDNLNKPVVIDGLWGLIFGNGHAGDTNTLYYSAGPNGESDGLFGKITANAAGTNPVTAAFNTTNPSELDITAGRGSDVVTIGLDSTMQNIVVRSDGQMIGSFPTTSVGSIKFTTFGGDDILVKSVLVTTTTTMVAGAGNDVFIGGSGINTLIGGEGNDVMIAVTGINTFIGGSGNNLLIGLGGQNVLHKGSGTNTLIGIGQIV